MPQAPPGICHREVYSELLASAGLLFERRYKAQQLADISQLQQRAKGYLARSLTNVVLNQGHDNNQGSLEGRSSKSPSPLNAGKEDYDECTPESIGHEAYEEVEPTSNEFHRIGTRVLLAVTDPERPENIEEDVKGSRYLEDTSSVGARIEIVHNSDIIEEAASDIPGDVRVNIEGVPELGYDEEGASPLPNRKRLRNIGLCCLAVQLLVSALLVALLYLCVHLEWLNNVDKLHIIYPFVVYFSTRVIVQGMFDWYMKRYLRLFTIPTTATAAVSLGLDRTRLVKAIANNLCLVLAVVAAALPREIINQLQPRKTLNNIYFANIAAIFTINVIATIYQYYRIGREMRKVSP
ncbi:uncharacterized protein BXIN_0585 [Babesia sp. Xinjiang]|uniref:uncharacterized protein n=1 Tax=Babesia sp. Xinjiang TaxID=462227 RepID=UPI000A250A47|nr:uncharacterized protein BXIN_0585 [Babesia sp. Xinjiang]ORM41823.1 hypothetical protein BXIN_0585 [Babesia sp. Xinjiang]